MGNMIRIGLVGLIILIGFDGSSTAAAAAAEPVTPQWLIDLDGQPLVLPRSEARATAVVFLGTQCPVSNRSIPTLNDLAKAHANDRDVDLLIVVSDPTLARKDVVKYRTDYSITP